MQTTKWERNKCSDSDLGLKLPRVYCPIYHKDHHENGFISNYKESLEGEHIAAIKLNARKQKKSKAFLLNIMSKNS